MRKFFLYFTISLCLVLFWLPETGFAQTQETWQLSAQAPVVSRWAHSVSVHPNGSIIYVTGGPDQIVAVDSDTLTVLASQTLPVGDSLETPSLAPDQSTLLVGAETGQLIHTVPSAERIIMPAFSPDGERLYVTGFDTGSLYVYERGNAAPTVDLPPVAGRVGEALPLTAAGSDPDGDPLTYAWDLDDDGQYDNATGITTTVAFSTTGIFTVGVRVTDAHGAQDTDSAPITVNDPTGSGFFIDSGQRLGTERSHGLALGDLDGDGDLDAFVGNIGLYASQGQPNKVWFNDGTGHFIDSGQNLGSSTQTYRALLGDLDGDGDLDAFTANLYNPNRVWINDGNGIFSDSGQRLGNYDTSGLALGDVDGDGDLDAFTANHRGQSDRVWLNDGAAGFTDSSQQLGNFRGADVDLGDIDGDGDLDAFVGSTNGQPNVVWLNDGQGTFSDSSQRLGDSTSHGRVWLRDLDGDGDLDASVGNGGSPGQPNRIWLNDGAGTFTDSNQELGLSNTHDLAVADLDDDGDLDMFIANAGWVPNAVWLNDGLASFTKTGQALGDSSSEGVALGDLDGDGDIDAFIANDQGPNTVWYNVQRTPVNALLHLEQTSVAYNPTPQAYAPAGVYTLLATFRNRSSSGIYNLYFHVSTLTGGNVVLNADGGPGGEGDKISVPPADLGTNGHLDPGESFTINFEIGLASLGTFEFFVDAHGVVDGVSAAAADGAEASFRFEVDAEDLQSNPSSPIYLPLVAQ